MDLVTWRKTKGYSQHHLASILSKKLNQPIAQSHISSWENGVMPRYDVGDMIRKLSIGKVSFESRKVLEEIAHENARAARSELP